MSRDQPVTHGRRTSGRSRQGRQGTSLDRAWNDSDVNQWSPLISVAGALIGVLVGSLLQARLTSRQQWANRVYDERIKTYIDLYADCHEREHWLDRLTRPYQDSNWEGRESRYVPGIPVDARVRLLSDPSVTAAWLEMLKSYQELSYLLEHEGWPNGPDDCIASSTPELVELRARLEALYRAVDAQVVVSGESRGRTR